MDLDSAGQIYYDAVREGNGSVVIVCSQAVQPADSKNVNLISSLAFSPLSAVLASEPPSKTPKGKGKGGAAGGVAADIEVHPGKLMAQIPRIIAFHRAAASPLPPGLYIGLLNCTSTMSGIQVQVLKDAPNTLPHKRSGGGRREKGGGCF